MFVFPHTLKDAAAKRSGVISKVETKYFSVKIHVCDACVSHSGGKCHKRGTKHKPQCANYFLNISSPNKALLLFGKPDM